VAPTRAQVGMDPAASTRQTDHMAAQKNQSAVAAVINGVGFLLAALLVMHIVLVLFRIPLEIPFAHAVERLATPLALFFPELINAPDAVLQVLVAYGLAAAFWIVVASLVARIFG
jgi:hypothetical protein